MSHFVLCSIVLCTLCWHDRTLLFQYKPITIGLSSLIFRGPKLQTCAFFEKKIFVFWLNIAAGKGLDPNGWCIVNRINDGPLYVCYCYIIWNRTCDGLQNSFQNITLRASYRGIYGIGTRAWVQEITIMETLVVVRNIARATDLSLHKWLIELGRYHFFGTKVSETSYSAIRF